MRQLKITKSITNRESQSLDKYLQEIGREELITAEMEVELAQKIKQGDVVGTVGKTGRATGPHLDIRLNWFDVKLDPATVLLNE